METLELMVVRRAVKLAVGLGYHWAVFEGDSETVFKALSRDVAPLSSLGHLLKDFLSLYKLILSLILEGRVILLLMPYLGFLFLY